MGRAINIYICVCVCKRLINIKKFIFRHQALGGVTADEYGSSRTSIITLSDTWFVPNFEHFVVWFLCWSLLRRHSTIPILFICS